MTGFFGEESKQRAGERLASGFWDYMKTKCFHCETLYQCGEIKKIEIENATWQEQETKMWLCSYHYYELKQLREEERLEAQ